MTEAGVLGEEERRVPFSRTSAATLILNNFLSLFSNFQNLGIFVYLCNGKTHYVEDVSDGTWRG